MALTCLDNLIGIKRNCTATTPTSGLYINSLPGITVNLLEKATDSEHFSAIDLIQEKIDEAEILMVQDIRNHYQRQQTMFSVVDFDTVGRFKENLELEPAETGQYKGIKFELTQRAYLELEIATVEIKLNAAISDFINIIDLMTGKIVDTIAFTSIADEPVTVNINKKYLSNKQRLQIFVAIDAGLAGAYEADFGFGLRGGCCGNDGLTTEGRHLTITPRKISKVASLINQNTSSINNTNGLSVSYSVDCTIDPLICNVSLRIANALRHRAGELIMLDLQVSNRMNSFIVARKETHKDLRDYFLDIYNKSMDDLFKHMVVRDDCCFQCEPLVKYDVVIP